MRSNFTLLRIQIGREKSTAPKSVTDERQYAAND